MRVKYRKPVYHPSPGGDKAHAVDEREQLRVDQVKEPLVGWER